MSFRKVGLALEDAEMAGVGGGDDSTVSGEDLAATEEVSSGSAEITADGGDLEGATGDTEMIEDIKEILEESVENGQGIDATTAAVVSAVTESFREKMGIRGRAMPSLESFGSASSRMTATNLALLSIGDTLSRAWEAIKTFFKNIWDKIKTFYKRVFTAVGRMKARALALRTKVANIDGKKDEDNFENSTYYSAFIGGDNKFSKANVEKYVVSAKDVIHNISKFVAGMSKLVDSAANTTAKNDLGITKQTVDSAVKPLFGSTVGTNSLGLDAGVLATDFLIGGQKLAFETESVAGAALNLKSNKKTKVKMRAVMVKYGKRDKDDDGEVDVLEISDMTSICTKVLGLCESIEGMDMVEKEVDAVVKKINKIADEAKKKIDDAKGSSDSSTDARTSIMAIGGSIQQASSKLPAIGIQTGSTALNYVEKSISFYK
jgi:hypothetical protein